jgi:hypothetical protein
MIVEERTYTLKPARIVVLVVLVHRAGLAIQKRILGNLIGYFHTEIGELNRVVHLWGYDSLAEREKRRKALFEDKDWLEYLKQSPDIVVDMQSRILIPAPFSPIR